MDEIDFIILQELLLDCKRPIKQIAEKVNLSITPVHERIKRMERSGVIHRYAAVIEPHALDMNLIVLMQIKLKEHQKAILKLLETEIRQFGEVLEAYFTAGDFDVYLKVLLRDMEDYNHFILERISELTMIDSIKSSFAIRSVLDDDVSKHLLSPLNLKTIQG
ncbi:Lrp/AsnC family transcriptional regulator [Mangrovimonas sp. CR14]|uniref:Lrp/AsnC family transcriptional regulator n=1 Tax=Mangrovimonas sp. CR14 TaxID=2706120 RepID=UPI0014249F00|nr:Lrp/AsnC family transcriptional regulator [Mangrovimonas sp. CR14]NIK93402.1 Lrp/AsnC family transcriptional regulator [Mangrovimonas sp. CR14]